MTNTLPSVKFYRPTHSLTSNLFEELQAGQSADITRGQRSAEFEYAYNDQGRISRDTSVRLSRTEPAKLLLLGDVAIGRILKVLGKSYDERRAIAADLSSEAFITGIDGFSDTIELKSLPAKITDPNKSVRANSALILGSEDAVGQVRVEQDILAVRLAVARYLKLPIPAHPTDNPRWTDMWETNQLTGAVLIANANGISAWPNLVETHNALVASSNLPPKLAYGAIGAQPTGLAQAA